MAVRVTGWPTCGPRLREGDRLRDLRDRDDLPRGRGGLGRGVLVVTWLGRDDGAGADRGRGGPAARDRADPRGVRGERHRQFRASPTRTGLSADRASPSLGGVKLIVCADLLTAKDGRRRGREVSVVAGLGGGDGAGAGRPGGDGATRDRAHARSARGVGHRQPRGCGGGQGDRLVDRGARGGVKEIVCGIFWTGNDFRTGSAAAYRSSPAWQAVMVQVPALMVVSGAAGDRAHARSGRGECHRQLRRRRRGQGYPLTGFGAVGGREADRLRDLLDRERLARGFGCGVPVVAGLGGGDGAGASLGGGDAWCRRSCTRPGVSEVKDTASFDVADADRAIR